MGKGEASNSEFLYLLRILSAIVIKNNGCVFLDESEVMSIPANSLLKIDVNKKAMVIRVFVISEKGNGNVNS